jgi:ABC-type branched-subunit amino acid transport system ATPase component
MVLNFGRKLAEGSPDVVMSSPTVKQIYMGIAA